MIKPHAFKHAVPVQQTMIKHRHRGIFRRNDGAINPATALRGVRLSLTIVLITAGLAAIASAVIGSTAIESTVIGLITTGSTSHALSFLSVVF